MQFKSLAIGLTAALGAAPAFAQNALETVGRPVDAGIGFQPAATELARDLQWLDGMILVIITAITLFVTALLAYCIIRYNRRANPTPSSFTHNTPIEIAWTVGPILVLVFIGAFSLPVLFKQQEIPESDLTIKVTGYQWYWGYEYVGEDLAYDSYMIGSPFTGGENRMSPDVEAQLVDAGFEKQDFLLATDTSVVVPVGKTVVMQITAADVIHSWTIPAFRVKQDAVPGRLAELWFNAEREGIYFGQCSELCGLSHAYMPITVKVVSEDAYAAWLAASKDEGTYVDVRTVLTN
jgi:cytochrome c oxidase subunit 2